LLAWPARIASYRSPAAFSLVELLVTLALLLVMVCMWHGFSSRGNQQRQKTACEKNLLTTYMALEIYANEHDGKFPAVPDARSSEEVLGLLVPRYTVASDRFVCPGSKDSSIPPASTLVERRISYTYFMGRTLTDTGAVLMSDRLIKPGPKTVGEAVFSADGKPPGNNHHQYGGNFLFSDGEVRSSGPTIPFALETAPNITVLNPR
jgi:hypothetical protein